MSTIFSLIGAIAGLSGLVFGVIGLIRNRMAAVTSYLEYTREPDFIEARSIVWDLSSYDAAGIERDRNKATKIETVINTYNMTGLLVRHHQLPKWFFWETAAGDTVVQFYEKLEPYILYLRKKNGVGTYANQFEYLYRLLRNQSPKNALRTGGRRT